MTRAPRPRHPQDATAADARARGRDAYARRAWQDAFEALTRADRDAPLDDEDLERLAWAGALVGRDDVQVAALERLHELRLARGDACGAVRAAFWLGMHLLTSGEAARASGWLARAERCLEHVSGECVEHGYMLVPEAQRLLARGEATAARDTAHRAAGLGERFGERELASMARTIEGRAAIMAGEPEAGLALLDEAMLPATTGRLMPFVTGVVYCTVIDCCRRLFAIDRAREWTAALAAWCAEQPQLGAFTGACRVHRSEILQLQGAWQEAIDEAERVVAGAAREGMGSALYQQGEILRLRGAFAEAEAAYRQASERGREPQPGLALLRLAQGRGDAAAAAIRQTMAAKRDPLVRARFLPAAVEILIAAGDLDGARVATRDLEDIAAHAHSALLDAMAAHARGQVRLAEGDAAGAVEPLRAAFAAWHQVDAPYLAARVRVALAAALEALGDADGAELERDGARAVFRDLGATPDLDRLEGRAVPGGKPGQPFGLTPRELEVLRLVATGRTNRAIAESLFLSEKTIDRHVSNIFTKLDVSSRAAATAFAYQHKLV